MAFLAAGWNPGASFCFVLPFQYVGTYPGGKKYNATGSAAAPYALLLLSVVFDQHQCLGLVIYFSYPR